MENLFGYTESVSLKEGVNEVTPKGMFIYGMGQYGPYVDFEFDVAGLDNPIRDRVFMPQEKMQDGSDNEYFKKQVSNMAQKLGQYVLGFYSELDEVKKKINEAAAAAGGDLEKFCELMKALLPEDWSTRKAQLLLHYKSADDKYLSVPKYAFYNDGILFVANDKRTLTVTDWFQKEKMGAKDAVSNGTASTPEISTEDWG